MNPKTLNSIIKLKKNFEKKMSLEWYSSGLSSSDESRNRLMRLLLRATVETEYFEVFGELFSVFIVILKCPP